MPKGYRQMRVKDLHKVPNVAARVGFEPATFRMQGTIMGEILTLSAIYSIITHNFNQQIYIAHAFKIPI